MGDFKKSLGCFLRVMYTFFSYILGALPLWGQDSGEHTAGQREWDHKDTTGLLAQTQVTYLLFIQISYMKKFSIFLDFYIFSINHYYCHPLSLPLGFLQISNQQKVCLSTYKIQN